MFTPKRLIRSVLISIWFMILVFPVVGIKIIKRAPQFFYERVLIIGIIQNIHYLRHFAQQLLNIQNHQQVKVIPRKSPL